MPSSARRGGHFLIEPAARLKALEYRSAQRLAAGTVPVRAILGNRAVTTLVARTTSRVRARSTSDSDHDRRQGSAVEAVDIITSAPDASRDAGRASFFRRLQRRRGS